MTTTALIGALTRDLARNGDRTVIVSVSRGDQPRYVAEAPLTVVTAPVSPLLIIKGHA